jgi:DNA-binding MarR family transcriptional regulator
MGMRRNENKARIGATSDTSCREVDVDTLGESFTRAWAAFTRHAERRFAEQGFSAGRVQILLEIGQSRGLRTGRLAEKIGVTGRTITAMVDALEEDGLVSRRRDPADRRAVCLELTQAGGAVLAMIEELQRTVSEEVFGGFDVEHRDRFVKTLDRLSRGRPHPGDDRDPGRR